MISREIEAVLTPAFQQRLQEARRRFEEGRMDVEG